uniref:Uncharacterized protein n=1 Tax=Sphaerodactylus townsendi TaxID=933632 RepID=A0ACB8F2K6_9SAUR
MPPTSEDSPLIGDSFDSLSSTSSGTLCVHLYHHPNSFQLAPDSAGSLNFTYGDYTAEQLCVAAAKVCGILPVYHPLFSLATEDLSCWYPPNHVFRVDESCSKVVVYRIRFFFPNWFGLQNSYRFGPANSQEKPVLDGPTLDYLFAQSRSDFISGQMDVSLNLESQETCLGLAVLDMLRISKERKQNLEETLRTMRFSQNKAKG